MFANVYANCAKFRRKRVVVDSVISEEEARVYTHDAKDAHGDPLFQIDEMFGVDAECSTAFQDWPDNPLNQEIPDRIRFLIRRHFSLSDVQAWPSRRSRLHMTGWLVMSSVVCMYDRTLMQLADAGLCMHACVYVCMYVRTYVRTHVCIHA